LDEFPIFVNGEEDNSGLRTFTLEPTRSLQAVEDRHRDVKYHNIRVEFGRGLKERLAVLDSVDNVELRLQDLARLVQHGGTIIGQEHARGGFAAMAARLRSSHLRPPLLVKA